MLRSKRPCTLINPANAAFLLITSVFFVSACGGGGAPPSPRLNPVPAITSLSPSTMILGATATTVTVNGSGFIQSSTAQWNQTNRVTTVASSTQLKVGLTAADLAAAGTGEIVVINPAPGGGTSNAATLAINNPNPQISGVSPGTVTTLDAGSTLTITGRGFVATSTATWNGATHPTTFVSGIQLKLTLLAEDVATVGSAEISVLNPAPGGGAASPSIIAIVYPVPVINSLSPTSVAWDSVPSSLTVNGAGFSPLSVVQLNGVTHATTYVNSNTLEVTLGASDLGTAATLPVTVFTGTPGGGTSTPAILTINYPVPAIASINPASITVNSQGTPIEILGSGFTSSSTVHVNGSTLKTSGWTSYQLSLTVPAAELTSVATLSITVSNPGTATSNAMTINVTPYPAPTLSGINPVSAAVGTADFTLTLSGSNFVPASTVQWNGAARPTTFVSGSQLTATISASDIALPGNYSVTVFNPSPGGGVSSPTTLTTYVGLATNDLVYDASRKLLWASVPSSAGAVLGNSVVSIDPYTGALGAPIWVGSEPNKLAISNGGSTLWVSLQGAPAARKVDLTAGVATPVELYFPGGWGGNTYATSLAVVPGSPSSVAVAAGMVGIYDDATERPKTGTSGATYLAFGANPGTLYGFSGGLSLFTVDSTGIAASSTLGTSSTYSNDLRYDNGRLYLTSGEVLDGLSGNLLGTFNASGPVAPDSRVGRAFVLNGSFSTPNQITAFDQNTFVPIDSFPVAGVQTDFNSPSSLVRWGENGLAFRTTQQIYILQTALVKDLSSTPADIAVSVTAPATSTTGTGTPITITVTNSGPSGATNVTLIDGFSANAIFVSTHPNQGSCAFSAVVRCDLGDLASGAAVTIALVVQPLVASTLTNAATVDAPQPDPNQANNFATSTIIISGTSYNPAPVLSSLSPQSALAGAPTLTLTVNGSDFSNASIVLWNGASLPTSFVSANQLTATVDASLITSAGSADVTVNSPVPGGGVSASLAFAIFQTVALDTNDIVFDPFTRKLYASVPSSATQVAGNSIVSIDPLTGTIGKPVFIGSEPTRIAVSDDGQYIYVVLSGSNAVRRMDLTTLTPGTQFQPVSAVFGSAFTASDLAVMPGDANVLATVGYANGIQVWDVTEMGATARPPTRTLVNDVYEGSVLAWADSTNLYSNDEGLSPSSFHRFVVGSTSFEESDSTYLDAVEGKISYSGGLIFADGGGVVDPSLVPPVTPQLVGRLGGGVSNAADTSINRVFFLSANSYGVNSRTVSAFDPTRFTSVGSTELDGLTGDAFDLIRWGVDGLAFRTATDFWGNGSGRVLLLHGHCVLPPSAAANPVPSISALSPSSITSPAGNTWLTVTGSKFVPGAILEWDGAVRATVFVNSGQLRAAIPAADLVAPQTVKVQVVNPTPGGGSSTIFNLTIN